MHGSHGLTSARLIAWQFVRACIPRASNPIYVEDLCIISIPRRFPGLILEGLVRNSVSQNSSLRQAAPKDSLGDLSFDDDNDGDDE